MRQTACNSNNGSGLRRIPSSSADFVSCVPSFDSSRLMDCTICATKYRGEQRSPPEEVLEARGILREIEPGSAVYRSRRSFPIFGRGSGNVETDFGAPDADPEVHM